MAKLTPNEERWINWLPTLEPHEQVAHDEANWTSCSAFCGGIESEAERLRPLLERCLRIVELYDRKLPLAADLRRELGIEAKP